MINPKIFKAYDIRGVYNKDFNAEDSVKIAKGIYKFFVDYYKGRKDLAICLGRDMRIGSNEIYEKVRQTLMEYPVQLIELGLVSTPSMYYSVLKYQADAGLHITASHNPKEYCGMKFVLREGDRIVKVSGAFGMEEVKENTLQEKFIQPDENKGSSREVDDFDRTAVEDNIKYFEEKFGEFRKRRLKVVVDSANGMGVLYLKHFFDKYKDYFEVVYINEELDGTFPAHEADPLKPENLKQLQEEIERQGADFGIGPDGDGDRIFFVDEKAQIVQPARVSSLIVEKVLSEGKGSSFVVDVRYVLNLRKICEKYGARLYEVRVGHSFITKKVNEVKAYFAGESSGHYFFYDFGGAENSLLIIMFILDRLGQDKEKTLSQIIDEVSLVHESGEYNFHLPEAVSAQALFEKLEERYKGGRVVRIDGFTVEFEGWRFNFRASNTEPLVRLNLEAEEADKMRAKLKEIMDYLESLGAQRA